MVLSEVAPRPPIPWWSWPLGALVVVMAWALTLALWSALGAVRSLAPVAAVIGGQFGRAAEPVG